MEDKDLVRCCVEELSRQMGYADAGALSQRDYEHLCETIAEKTGILISLSTLKRIFAGKFERLPQGATLNALTRFLGYAGWQDFKTRKRLEPRHRPLPPAEPPHQPLLPAERPLTESLPLPPQAVARPDRHQRVAPFLKATALLLVVSLGVLVFFLATKQKEQPGAPAGEVVFAARKAVAAGVPNSVVFSYNVDHVAADSFFIQQSWDPSRRVAVGKKNYTQTDIYYEPGYHKAKLIGNGKVLKEIPVSIPSAGWMAYSRAGSGLLPQYVNGPVVHDGRLGVTLQDLRASGIDPQEDRYYLYAFFPPVLGADGDHFTLKVRLRVRPVKPTRCPGMLLGAYGENGLYYFKNTIPGCISEIDAAFGDVYLSGKKNDLSGFGQDVLNWHEMEMRVSGKRVKILADGKPVFETAYGQPVGGLKGINLVSNGLCEVDWVTIEDAAGKALYRNDFDAS